MERLTCPLDQHSEGSSDVNGAALQGWQDSNNPEEGYDDTYAEEAVETDY